MNHAILLSNKSFKARLENLLDFNCPSLSVEIFNRRVVIEEIQKGPTCGLFCIKLAGRILEFEDKYSTEDLLKIAKNNKFTNNGELFSALWVMKLCQQIWPKANCREIEFPTPEYFVEALAIKQALIIVPYDCDRNFEPCLQNGTKAHWCIITGFLIVDRTTNRDEGKNFVSEYTQNLSRKIVEPNNFYLIPYHGKSRHPGIWSYNSIKDSNAQLYKARNNTEKETFLLPEQGLSAIREKCIYLGVE